MALKVGRFEVGFRLFISLVAIAIAYGYLGSYLRILLHDYQYWTAGALFLLAVVAVFALPRSLGGLIAALAAIVTIFIKSNPTDALIGAGICLLLYWFGFRDVRYDPKLDKKFSINDLIATALTIALAIAIAVSILQFSTSWLSSLAIGAIAAAITLIGQQIKDLELSPKISLTVLGTFAGSSLAIGFAIKAVSYLSKQTGVS